MLVSDVISVVRPQISDTVATYRWSDALLIPKVADAIYAIWKRRPTVATTAPTTVTATSDTVPYADSWKVALAHHVAWSVLMEDSEDAANFNLAQAHFTAFDREMA